MRLTGGQKIMGAMMESIGVLIGLLSEWCRNFIGGAAIRHGDGNDENVIHQQ
jgi:hypothetical protein